MRRASGTGANAEMMSDVGASTVCKPSTSVHEVRIDSESLPTGMVMPSEVHSSAPTARTVA